MRSKSQTEEFPDAQAEILTGEILKGEKTKNKVVNVKRRGLAQTHRLTFLGEAETKEGKRVVKGGGKRKFICHRYSMETSAPK